MATGTIKKLVGDRGFGFIQTEDGSDIFFHRSQVENDAFDTLREGQSVNYEKGTDPRRGKPRSAVRVRSSRVGRAATGAPRAAARVRRASATTRSVRARRT